MLPAIFATALLAGGAIRPPAPPVTRLVVLIVIDQMRPDYLERYRAQWTGGFKRLLEHAALFSNGRQDHAVTETAPGHATLLSGRTPAHTGIASNSAGVSDRDAPLIGVTGPGASPRRFIGTTLCDWLIRQDSAVQVLSVSRKDRGAIFPVGRAKGQVYWYAGGQFTSSRYYMSELPEWVRAFDARPTGAALAGRSWNLLLSPDQYAEPDSMPFENGGRNYLFPHRLPVRPDSMALHLEAYPWMDSLTLDLALEGVRANRMGVHERTDILSISLSTLDEIGHSFGPDSREVHDMLLRLDRWLGRFEDSLSTMVPVGRTLYVLTSDHGVQSFPEYAAAVRHQESGRVWPGQMMNRLRLTYAQYHNDFGFRFDAGLLSADTGALRARGIKVDSLAQSLAAEARAIPGVSGVFTPVSLRAARADDDPARLWRRLIPADRGWLIASALKPGYMWQQTPGSTNHGTTNLLDQTIPIAFWGPRVKPGIYQREVSSVDIAPTLAAMLGVRPTESLDGRILPEVVPRSAPVSR
jgi:predicted AlkP superfamily pyrophosphatase or phosphodiesterase